MKLLQNFLAASVDHVEGLGHLANLLATFDKKGKFEGRDCKDVSLVFRTL